ncbi:hypothetical protein NLI96_g4050 [Meripilus lineatus]|uniref:Integral membrane protein n=1 Tax=Meripilus lineatus TaxID=2056292 RepID=A0AAD5V5L1_9APHY|nr:hypothetical protein NLI96_g4050 [Physisporinus lineatus]
MSTPPFPSLYNFAIEIIPIEHRGPISPGGEYLYHPHDIFRFTLYWTLIFYTPAFVLCGSYVLLNITFPPHRYNLKEQNQASSTYRSLSSSFQLQSATSSHPELHTTTSGIPLESLITGESHHPLSPRHARPHAPPRIRLNQRRSRVTFALIVLLTFLTFSVAGAVVGSAIVGYTLAGLFKAAHWTMSTWVPFFGGLSQALIGLLGSVVSFYSLRDHV